MIVKRRDQETSIRVVPRWLQFECRQRWLRFHWGTGGFLLRRRAESAQVEEAAARVSRLKVRSCSLTPEAAVLTNIAATFMAVFTHANIRTPRWLGYLIARPEMHAVHHERGAHSGNYCDLPVIDMIFGTYRNPETFDGEAGFYEGASLRINDMLLGSDVSMPPETESLVVTGPPTLVTRRV